MCKISGTWARILPKVSIKLRLPVTSAHTKQFQTPLVYLGTKGPYPPLPGHKRNMKKEERNSVQK